MTAMAQRKPNPDRGDRHAKKRIGVNFPEDWHALLRKLAAAKKMPVLWYIMDMAAGEAKDAGIPHPSLPWEEQPGS